MPANLLNALPSCADFTRNTLGNTVTQLECFLQVFGHQQNGSAGGPSLELDEAGDPLSAAVGVQALAVHGRTRACGYRGTAEYATIQAAIDAASPGDIIELEALIVVDGDMAAAVEKKRAEPGPGEAETPSS